MRAVGAHSYAMNDLTPSSVLLYLLRMQMAVKKMEDSVAKSWCAMALNRACGDALNAVGDPTLGYGCVSEVLSDVMDLVGGELGEAAELMFVRLNHEANEV